MKADYNIRDLLAYRPIDRMGSGLGMGNFLADRSSKGLGRRKQLGTKQKPLTMLRQLPASRKANSCSQRSAAKQRDQDNGSLRRRCLMEDRDGITQPAAAFESAVQCQFGGGQADGNSQRNRRLEGNIAADNLRGRRINGSLYTKDFKKKTCVK